MNSLLLETVKKIRDFTGIVVSTLQYDALMKYIAEKSHEKHISPEEYCGVLVPGSAVFNELIRTVTINETYFFREEKQFAFLQSEIFSEARKKSFDVWCGACSTGEEPYSVLALALESGVNVNLYATDIDSTVLSALKAGVYTKNSFRQDGAQFHPGLKNYGRQNEAGLFVLDREFAEKVTSGQFNLLSDRMLPWNVSFDIIFLRNVFIYFEKETRKKILEQAAGYLKPDGKLFLSVNEIGCIDDSALPSRLYKTHFNSVYYLQKRSELPVKENVRTQAKKIPFCVSAPYAKVCSEKKSVVSLAAVHEEICRNVHESRFEEAKNIAVSLGKDMEMKPFSYFFRGYVEYHSDNKKAAEILFASSYMVNPDFWPAYFYHGIVLKDMGMADKADQCFDRCKNLLDSVQPENRYGFILGSFSLSYIQSLCRQLKS